MLRGAEMERVTPPLLLLLLALLALLASHGKPRLLLLSPTWGCCALGWGTRGSFTFPSPLLCFFGVRGPLSPSARGAWGHAACIGGSCCSPNSARPPVAFPPLLRLSVHWEEKNSPCPPPSPFLSPRGWESCPRGAGEAMCASHSHQPPHGHSALPPLPRSQHGCVHAHGCAGRLRGQLGISICPGTTKDFLLACTQKETMPSCAMLAASFSPERLQRCV